MCPLVGLWVVGFFFSSRVDFLEMENRKLGKKVLHVSSQLAVLERRLQNRESADPTEVPTQLHFHKLTAVLPVIVTSLHKEGCDKII